MIDKCKCNHCGEHIKTDESFKEDSNLAMIIKYGEQPINILINCSKSKKTYELLINIMNYFVSLGIPECNVFSTNSRFSLFKNNFQSYNSEFVNGYTNRVHTLLSEILRKQSQKQENDNRNVLIIDSKWTMELKDSIIINELFNKSKENNMYIVYLIDDREINIPDGIKNLIDVTISESSVFNVSTKI